MSTSSLLLDTPVRETTWPSIWIVAAHPDDEVIGLGGQLPFLKESLFVHVTDGATLHHPQRGDYAAARRAELLSALEIAGIDEQRTHQLGFADQEASFRLSDLTLRLHDLWLERTPDIVYTHPYEGGHPDHDATAFAVHAACKLLDREGVRSPEIWEFACYHAGPDGMSVFEFLPSEQQAAVITLSPDACARKRSMLACFRTQQDMIRNFPAVTEAIRPAPSYDFTVPPHEGTLFYEHFDWGVEGDRWRLLARDALSSLRVQAPV